MPLRDFLLPEFDEEMAKTRSALERCPEDKYGWKPHPRSFSMGALATHLAHVPGWGAAALTCDSLDIAPPGAPPYSEEPSASRKEMLERFDRGVAEARAALAAASDEQLAQNWSLLAGGETLFSMARLSVVRMMVLNHGIHHRAQLGVYLRLNGIPVPATYGPSADEGAM